MTDTNEATTDPRADFTAGLRSLAEFYDTHPEFPLPYQSKPNTGDMFSVGAHGDGDPAVFAGLVRQLGGDRTKSADDTYYEVIRPFGGGVDLRVWEMRETVCSAVVVGTETVIEHEVVTPAVTRRVEKERDVIEWVCAPVLAESA